MSDPAGIVITHTDIHTFLTCRRLWHWSYVQDFRPPEKFDGPLALGTRVHSSLEWYYDGKGDPIERHQVLLNRDLDAADASDAPPWVIDQLYKDAIIGRNCVTAHQEWLASTGADDPYEIEAVERQIDAPLLDGRVILRGKVDVLFRSKVTDFLELNDLKTDGGRPGLREQLERSWQHHVYLIALRLAYPDEVIDRAHYTVIRKMARPASSSTPMVVRHPVPGTTRTAGNKLRQLEIICTEMLRSMEAVHTEGNAHAYPSPNHECQWCAFRQPCEIVDESSEAARAMLDSLFIRGGRHERYT